MAQDITDPTYDAGASGGDWFTQNAPDTGTGGAQPKATAADVAQMYRNLLGREASPEEIQSTLTGGSYDLNSIQGSIASSPEAQAYAQAHPTGIQTATGGNGGAAPTLNRNDPASVAAYVSYYANQPGANPSLKNDPNYWIGKISSGELGDDPNYIVSKFMLPEGAPAGATGAANPYAALGTSTLTSGFGAPPAPYASNPNAPGFTLPQVPGSLSTPYAVQGSAPNAPTFTPYTLPTMAQAEADPGYAFGLTQGTNQIQRAAASNGTVLNPGTVQALNRYGTDYATTKYNDLVTRGLAVNQNNNNLLQTGFGDAFSGFTANNEANLAARQQNQSEFQQNVVAPTQTLQGNQYAAYLNENARTLNDYLTNYNIQHTADSDYWSRLKDVSGSGLAAALGDKAAA